MTKRSRKVQKSAIGIDVGDKYSFLCVLSPDGDVLEESKIPTRKAAFDKRFRGVEPVRIALEAGTHSPWLTKLLQDCGHEVVVANPRKVALIAKNDNKHDKADAQLLARLLRADAKLLAPVQPKGEDVDAARALLRARDVVVAGRSQLINHVRGAVKSAGGRAPRCSAEAFGSEAREEIPRELRLALFPVLDLIEMQTKQIRALDKQVAEMGKTRFPITETLQTISGVGPVTALGFVATIGDPTRFAKSRAVGAYLGLRPRRDESGDSAPELRITKAGDGFMRKLLVQAAHCHIARGPDTALQRWGLAIAARGRKNAKKRAIVAVARKLSVIMHRMWVTGTVYEPNPGGSSN